MIVKIGETAGQIWHFLNQVGESSLTQIKKEIDADDFLITAAIGWLARENKVKIDRSGRKINISLF
ncbi:MAG TPA: winged helix-turn-helix domain-containing protein [bacterium]|nr:winged helix-turn-helix domain-containing protein [bacterium]HNT65633.1 winged helix-turn-helix domain-containing protein [bacterium]HOX86144.1 winged helix-turn-helix domain-containing protein [bacterium]HPG45642.1 winged helix-turn-helix domain-containing protein [bacterium]HPM97579.1 winged helix-turn-helix domain-containing protein [bacterium]